MFVNFIFTLMTRLLWSQWVTSYSERHGPYEESLSARWGPLSLGINSCFVLDHEDVHLALDLPLPGGVLGLTLTVCRGADRIRQPGVRCQFRARGGG